MAIKELVTRFGFEIDDHGLKELEEGIESIKEGLLHLGELLIGEAVGLYELVEKSAEAGVHLKIMSQETGLAAEKLQELQFRAKLADVSTDELNMSMNFLARNLESARQGSEEARKNFRLLGISTAEIRAGTVSMDTVLKRMSATFQKLPDGPKKTGLAMEIFGRAGARMVPFLNSLNHELSPINAQILQMSMITEDQIEASEEFHVNLETLKTALVGVARVVGFGLIPVATEIIESMKKWVVENRQLIVQNLTGFVRGMASALKLTNRIVDALVQSFAGFAHSIGGVETATRFLLGTMAVLSGATVLFGIGKVIEAVVALGNSFAVANLKAAAIPIAIGAAMVAIFLIMEDIYSFFTGKKSFLGDLLNVLPEVGKVFKSNFEPIFEPFVNLITMVSDGFGSWTDLLKELGILILNVLLTPLRAVAATIGGIGGFLGRVTGIGALQDVGAAGSKAADFLKIDSALTGPSAVTGIGPSSVAGTPGGKQTNNNVQLKQEFNFPPGTDPAVVGDKISKSVSDGMDEALRHAHRAAYNGGAY